MRIPFAQILANTKKYGYHDSFRIDTIKKGNSNTISVPITI